MNYKFYANLLIAKSELKDPSIRIAIPAMKARELKIVFDYVKRYLEGNNSSEIKKLMLLITTAKVKKVKIKQPKEELKPLYQW